MSSKSCWKNENENVESLSVEEQNQRLPDISLTLLQSTDPKQLLGETIPSHTREAEAR
jgi:hypothetical protein